MRARTKFVGRNLGLVEGAAGDRQAFCRLGIPGGGGVQAGRACCDGTRSLPAAARRRCRRQAARPCNASHSSPHISTRLAACNCSAFLESRNALSPSGGNPQCPLWSLLVAFGVLCYSAAAVAPNLQLSATYELGSATQRVRFLDSTHIGIAQGAALRPAAAGRHAGRLARARRQR